MGGTQSKSSIDVLNSISSSVTQNIVKSCSTAATQNQLIQIQNVAGDVDLTGTSQKQGTSINSECLFSSNTQADLQNKLAQDLVNKADASGFPIVSALGSTKADAIINLKNQFSSSVNQSDLQQSITTSLQQQQISVANVGGNVIAKGINQDQTSEIVAKSIMQSSGYASVINDLAQKIDQKSTSSESIFGNFFSNISSYFLIGMVVVGLIFFIIFMWIMYKLFFSSNNDTSPFIPQQMMSNNNPYNMPNTLTPSYDLTQNAISPQFPQMTTPIMPQQMMPQQFNTTMIPLSTTPQQLMPSVISPELNTSITPQNLNTTITPNQMTLPSELPLSTSVIPQQLNTTMMTPQPMTFPNQLTMTPQ